MSPEDEVLSPNRREEAEQPTLRRQGGAVVDDLRDAVLHLVRYVESLCELFQLEMQSYVQRQKNCAIGVIIGFGFIGCAYLFLCALAAMLLAPVLTAVWAVTAVVLFNVFAGLVALLVAGLSRPSKLAPDTVQEIKNDIECAKLYLNAKGKR